MSFSFFPNLDFVQPIMDKKETGGNETSKKRKSVAMDQLKGLKDIAVTTRGMKTIKDVLSKLPTNTIIGEQFTEKPRRRPITKYLNLWIKCKSLPNLDFFSLTDPMVSLFIKDEKTFLWKELDRTDISMDTLDPEFTKSIFVNSLKVQPPEIKDENGFSTINTSKNLRFVCVDIDSDSPIGDDNFIGVVDWSIFELLNSKTLSLNLELLLQGRSRGQLIVAGEYIDELSLGTTVQISLGCVNIPIMDLFSYSDVYFVVKRRLKTPEEHERGGCNGPTLHTIYTSEVKKNSKNGIFKTFSLNV